MPARLGSIEGFGFNDEKVPVAFYEVVEIGQAHMTPETPVQPPPVIPPELPCFGVPNRTAAMTYDLPDHDGIAIQPNERNAAKKAPGSVPK